MKWPEVTVEETVESHEGTRSKSPRQPPLVVGNVSAERLEEQKVERWVEILWQWGLVVMKDEKQGDASSDSFNSLHVPRGLALRCRERGIPNRQTWFVINRQIHEDLGIPFFLDISALTETSDSKFVDEGNPLAWQIGRYFCYQRDVLSHQLLTDWCSTGQPRQSLTERPSWLKD
jgi:hypothetical protein